LLQPVQAIFYVSKKVKVWFALEMVVILQVDSWLTFEGNKNEIFRRKQRGIVLYAKIYFVTPKLGALAETRGM